MMGREGRTMRFDSGKLLRIVNRVAGISAVLAPLVFVAILIWLIVQFSSIQPAG